MGIASGVSDDMGEDEPVFWPIPDLLRAFRARELSPQEVTNQVLSRIESFDGVLHSYLNVTAELARTQARQAESRYRQGNGPLPPLLGVPVSIKDLFDVRGAPTTLGSLTSRGAIAARDSVPVRLLREAGAVFVGKSNTAEFGQSATTENLLGPGCANPWDTTRTAGGSSGGAAASVAAGLASAALGSDGGGSVRLPAAMCGLFGLKQTGAPMPTDEPFRAMTDFVVPGPLVRRVADARLMLQAAHRRAFPRRAIGRQRLGWCPAPQSRPVDRGVAAAVAQAVSLLAVSGHEIEEISLPMEDWMEAFGPLVLADEWQYRSDLLDDDSERLTEYARTSIEAGAAITEDDVAAARAVKADIGQRLAAMFERYDFIVTPTTACVAFEIGERPTHIDGHRVDSLWGPFPFTAAFNVTGSPAASVPCGISDGLPVGIQIVARHHGESRLLDLCEELEELVDFPRDRMPKQWALPTRLQQRSGDISIERRERVAVIRLNRPAKLNAMTREALQSLPQILYHQVTMGARALVLSGSPDVFSAGVDLAELAGDPTDISLDTLIGDAVRSMRSLPVPTVAAIEGPCVGAAVEIAMACDVRIAGAGTYFYLPAAQLGLLYRPEAVATMTEEFGRQTAARLLIFGDRISADEAANAGMVAKVVVSGQALGAAVALAAHAAEPAAETVSSVQT
jgi:Asp-tRNA(Asn)/Glu-tRNA(Gln) amidotransferase A subunit family amidase/enoyl-CoA hydratase/carnithine racemase